MTRSLLMFAAALSLVGCGGGDGGRAATPEEERAISSVVERNFTKVDPARQCRELLSKALVERSYGSVEACERDLKESAEVRVTAEAVDVKSVKVDGEEATATLSLSGGSATGLSGGLALVREGGSWRIDKTDTALARSLIELTLLSGAEDLPADVVGCVHREVGKLSGGEVDKLSDPTPDAGAARQVYHLTDECTLDGVTLQRALVEQGMLEGIVEEGGTRKQGQCIVDALRKDVSDDEMVDALAEGEDKLTKLITPTIERCLS